MTEQEQNSWIANKVMGWHVHRSEIVTDTAVVQYYDDKNYPTGNFLTHLSSPSQQALVFNPRNDLNHAEKALKAWCKSAPNGSIYSYQLGGGEDYNIVTLCDTEAMCYPGDEAGVLAEVENESLSVAITKALCKATGYKEVSG